MSWGEKCRLQTNRIPLWLSFIVCLNEIGKIVYSGIKIIVSKHLIFQREIQVVGINRRWLVWERCVWKMLSALLTAFGSRSNRVGSLKSACLLVMFIMLCNMNSDIIYGRGEGHWHTHAHMHTHDIWLAGITAKNRNNTLTIGRRDCKEWKRSVWVDSLVGPVCDTYQYVCVCAMDGYVGRLLSPLIIHASLNWAERNSVWILHPIFSITGYVCICGIVSSDCMCAQQLSEPLLWRRQKNWARECGGSVRNTVLTDYDRSNRHKTQLWVARQIQRSKKKKEEKNAQMSCFFWRCVMLFMCRIEWGLFICINESVYCNNHNNNIILIGWSMLPERDWTCNFG